MKRVLRTVELAVLIMVMCVGMLAPAASAATLITGKIPVTVTMTGSVPQDGDTVTIQLKAVDNAPMPTDAKDGVATLEIECDDAEKQAFFSIPYSHLGVYKYTVTMKAGDHALGEYDTETVFDVTVSITNNEKFDGYDVTVAAYLSGGKEKGDIVFENYYAAARELTVVKKWSDDGDGRPASVEIQLMRDETVWDTVTLSRKNDWQYTWEDLDSRYAWTVKEKKVPTGYTVSYKYQDGIWTVTNTESLMQTGQLNWPIPVLSIAGVSAMSAGLFLIISRKKDKNA